MPLWAAAMASHRHERAESTLRREISRIVASDVRDPEAANVYISSVALAPDKRSARVLVRPLGLRPGQDPDPLPLQALERATPFIRKTLSQCLRMRQVPGLQFTYDLGEQHSQRIDNLLKRIEKRSRKGLPAILVGALLQFAIPAQAEPLLQRIESSAAIMGSEFRIACYAPTKKRAIGAITAAFDEVRRIDRLLSHYKETSELSKLNREASNGDVKVSRELADLLDKCMHFSKESEGAFDITVGSLVKAWGFYDGTPAIPNALVRWWAKRNSGYQHLRLNRPASTVRFLRSGLQLDPGGIGKGYAVDRAIDVLRDYGIERALVSSGTSSIYALGTPPDNTEGWLLTIRAPWEQAVAGTAVRLRDEALSTSASYEKFFEEDGRRYGHILDPRTGEPARGIAAVSVIAPLTIDTEAWSTALYVNGAEWARNHPIRDGRVFLCEENGPCGWLAGR